jgi:flagellar biosynthesis/type III secretory pathway protein FliH
VLTTEHGKVELGIEAQLRALRDGLHQGWIAAA